MSLVGLFWHVIVFLAPAAWVALVLGLAGRFLSRKKNPWHYSYALFAMVFGCGGLTLLVGLWVWGSDGKMSTYAALVVVCASVQWAADLWGAGRGRH